MKSLSNLGKYKNYGLWIIRVGLGILFIYHGYPKLFGGPHKWEGLGGAMGYMGIHFSPVAWGFLSAITETIGGLLVILGLAFRPVCILISCPEIRACINSRIKGSSEIKELTVIGASYEYNLNLIWKSAWTILKPNITRIN